MLRGPLSCAGGGAQRRARARLLLSSPLALHCFVLRCSALLCSALFCSALFCCLNPDTPDQSDRIALHCIASHLITSHHISSHLITSHHTASHRIAPQASSWTPTTSSTLLAATSLSGGEEAGAEGEWEGKGRGRSKETRKKEKKEKKEKKRKEKKRKKERKKEIRVPRSSAPGVKESRLLL